jgi:hypothetical protein
VVASSERLASGGDHISTDGSGHLCTDDSPAVATTSARAPLRRGPRPRLTTVDDNEAIKAKEWEARRQVASVVSPAEATTSVVGSLTSGSDHLGTDDSGHLCTGGGDHLCTGGLPATAAASARAKWSSLPSSHGSEDKTIQERGRHPPQRTTSCTTPRATSWMWRTCAWRDRRPCDGRTATPRPSGRRQRRRRRQSHLGQGSRHAVADGACSRSAPSSRSLPPPQGW